MNMNKKLLKILLTLTMTTALTVGCAGSKEAEVAESENPVVSAITAEDLDSIVEGITDHYVLKDAKDIDYMYGVTYEESIVQKVEVDTSEVKVDEPGTYTVTYTVYVDKSAYEENALKEESTESESEEDVTVESEGQEETTTVETEEIEETEDSEAEPEIEKVEIEKDIVIVDEDTAQELIEEGKEVWGDKNVAVEKEESAEEEKEEDKKDSTSSKDKQETSKPSSGTSNNSSTNSSTGNTSSSSTSSKPSSGSSNNSSTNTNTGNTSSSSSSSSKPSHTHSYTIPITKTVEHEATGHYETVVVEAAWDEPIYQYGDICNGCNEFFTDFAHLRACKSSYHYGSKVVGYEHHDAVTKQQWVEDTKAWTQTVTTGYKCSCGAIQ